MKKIYKKIAGNIKTILFTIVMLLLILSFAMWGIADVVRNILSSSNAAVEIDGKKISNQVIDNNFRQYLAMIGQNNNTTISIEDGVKAGALDQSVKKLTSEIALNKEAKNIGIEINDELIAKQISEDKYFTDEDGNFDQEKFELTIAYSGYASEKHFLKELKREKARIDLLKVVKSGVQTSKYTEELLKKYDREVRTAKYIILPFDEKSIDASDENLKKYYEENISNYKTDELKNISVLMIKKENIQSEDLTEEEIDDTLLSQVDLVDTLLTEEVNLDDISSEVDIKLTTFKDINPKDVSKYYDDDSKKDMREILGTVMEMGYENKNTSKLIEATNGNYFVVRIDGTTGNKPKAFNKVKKEVKEKYIEDTAQENRRKQSVEFVKQINNNEKTLDDIAKETKFKVKTSMQFHRLPKSKELAKLSPIAIAQLFTKETVGEAGISMIKDGVFLFVLDTIEYEEESDEAERMITGRGKSPEEMKNDISYLMIESFANDLLDKYNAKINYKALDNLYDINEKGE